MIRDAALIIWAFGPHIRVLWLSSGFGKYAVWKRGISWLAAIVSGGVEPIDDLLISVTQFP